MSLHIYIDTVHHSEQRYPTVGDYYDEVHAGLPVPVSRILVSEIDNADFEFLIALHELIEMYLCKKRGISEAAITSFDIQFEQARTPESLDEPGNSIDAPYHKEHIFATSIERLVACELGINWDAYDTVVNTL